MHTLPQNRYKSVLWHIASVFKVKNGRLNGMIWQLKKPWIRCYRFTCCVNFTSIYIKLQYPPIMNHCQKGGAIPSKKKVQFDHAKVLTQISKLKIPRATHRIRLLLRRVSSWASQQTRCPPQGWFCPTSKLLGWQRILQLSCLETTWDHQKKK